MKNMSKLICPICSQALTATDNAYKCPSRHSFDISKQGYVNLLLPTSKGTHGDNKEMIRARRDFLEKGHYRPMCEALTESVADFAKGKRLSLLDAGCGEGYYTSSVSDATNCSVVGIDISKDALVYASKRLPDAELAVASVYRIPTAPDSFDIILNMFAPFEREEYLRVLRRGGHLFMVIPGEDHLFELKAAIYDEPYKNRVAPFEIEGFELVSHKEIKYRMNLASHEDIMSLFKMTPYYYRTSPQNKEKLSGIESIDVYAHFIILEYEK